MSIRGIQLTRLRIGIIGEPLWMLHWASGFHKTWSSWLYSSMKWMFTSRPQAHSQNTQKYIRSVQLQRVVSTTLVLTKISSTTHSYTRCRLGTDPFHWPKISPVPGRFLWYEFKTACLIPRAHWKNIPKFPTLIMNTVIANFTIQFSIQEHMIFIFL